MSLDSIAVCSTSFGGTVAVWVSDVGKDSSFETEAHAGLNSCA